MYTSLAVGYFLLPPRVSFFVPYSLSHSLPYASSLAISCSGVTPGFKAKPNACSMCSQELSLHTYHMKMDIE
jgi:hypothetical protein